MQQPEAQIEGAVSNQRLITKSGLFFYVFSLLIFVFAIVYFSEIRRGFSMLKKLNIYWLLLAFVLQLLTYLINAFIYRLLLKIYKTPVVPSLKEFYKAAVISLFFNQTIPSAGISGNTFLFHYLEKKNISSTSILSLILLELLSFYVAIEFFILLFIGLSVLKTWPYVFHSVLLAGFLVYLLFAIGIIMMGRKKTFDLLYKKFGKRRWVKVFFQKVKSDFEEKNGDQDSVELITLVKKQPFSFIKVFLFQLLLFATDIFTIVALFNGLGEHISLIAIALGLICTKIISLLPFLPGSLIVYESSMSFFFVKLGMLLAPSIIVTLIYRLLSFWLPMPAGLLLYRSWLRQTTKN